MNPELWGKLSMLAVIFPYPWQQSSAIIHYKCTSKAIPLALQCFLSVDHLNVLVFGVLPPADERSLGQGHVFTRMCHSAFMSGWLVPCSFYGGLCLRGVSVQQSLSVQGGLCPGGLCPAGSLSRGSLSWKTPPPVRQRVGAGIPIECFLVLWYHYILKESLLFIRSCYESTLVR